MAAKRNRELSENASCMTLHAMPPGVQHTCLTTVCRLFAAVRLRMLEPTPLGRQERLFCRAASLPCNLANIHRTHIVSILAASSLQEANDCAKHTLNPQTDQGRYHSSQASVFATAISRTPVVGILNDATIAPSCYVLNPRQLGTSTRPSVALEPCPLTAALSHAEVFAVEARASNITSQHRRRHALSSGARARSS